MAIRVTITAPNVFDTYGNLLPVGNIYTPPSDGYATSLIRSLKATDTDSVLNATENARFVPGGRISIEPASRTITNNDYGKTLEASNASLTFTLPYGLNLDFWFNVIPKGTTSIASSGGALLNGATTTITRADTANTIFTIYARATAPSSYLVTGS